MENKQTLIKIILGIVMIILLAWLIIPTLSFAESEAKAIPTVTENAESIAKEAPTAFSTDPLNALIEKEIITVTDGWAKPTLTGQSVGAAYLTLTNNTDKTLGLTGAESDAIGRIELHTHLHKNGMMQMRQLPRLDILPGVAQVMEPGGLHLMLFDMTAPFKEGNEIPIQLTFSDGSHLEALIRVKQPE